MKLGRLIAFILLANVGLLIGVNFIPFTHGDKLQQSIKGKTSVIDSYQAHSPIVVANNTDFNTTEWSGLGTSEDPYILENYSINASIGSGISISNTNVYFIIRHVEIIGITNSQTGAFTLNNVTHGLLINNIAKNSFYGFFLSNSSNSNVLSNNEANANTNYGFSLQSSSYNNTLIYNKAFNSNEDGFCLQSSSHNNTLSHNISFNNTLHGFNLIGSNNNKFINNTSYSNGNGFNLEFSSNFNVLVNNTAFNNSAVGFLLIYSSNYNILMNNSAFTNNLDGFVLRLSDFGNLLTNNTSSYNMRWGYYIGFPTSNNSLKNNLAINNGQNAVDNSDGTNSWNSNFYSDFSGNAPYIIPGSAGALDVNPLSLITTISSSSIQGTSSSTLTQSIIISSESTATSVTTQGWTGLLTFITILVWTVHRGRNQSN